MTFYGEGSDSGAACKGWDLIPEIKHPTVEITAALGAPYVVDPDNAPGCGQCILVELQGKASNSPADSAKVFDELGGCFCAYVNNRCPECGLGDEKSNNVDSMFKVLLIRRLKRNSYA